MRQVRQPPNEYTSRSRRSVGPANIRGRHERFGVAPHYQFTGAGPEEVEIEGTVYPEYFPGLEDIRRLPDTRAALLITSSHGIVFKVPDLLSLDRHSRRLLERFL